MNSVLISGSFDPPTIGHLTIINECSEIFEKVYVCIFVNAQKTPMFSKEKRLDMLKAMTAHLDNVIVDFYGGMVADYTRNNNIRFIARGIRDEKDMEYELSMARYNASLNGNLKTVFIPCSDDIKEISSSRVRKRIKASESIEGLVDTNVLKIIEEMI